MTSHSLPPDQHIVSDQLDQTILWLMQHQDIFDSLSFDVHTQQLVVKHVAGEDILREGMYLTAQYGILVTS
ncbi:hypothetical protein [Acinetobacter ihumii]|uniref:hypothetical protein n=1 Tax=Acinetobacter ihumii TaxID=2483802 RepID=UPI001030FB32|nr:hypothetical protein [Acinetobacter ihumii]